MDCLKPTVFSGVMPRSCGIKSQIVEDCVTKKRQLVILDFHPGPGAWRFDTADISLGDLVPYLSASECIDLLADSGGNQEDGFRFLVERFVLLFQELSQTTGLCLLDLESWSLLGLLNAQSPAFSRIKQFLENNYPSIPALENYLYHVARQFEVTRTDVNAALVACRPLYHRFDCGKHASDQMRYLLRFLKCVTSLLPAEDTCLLFDGMPYNLADVFTALPSVLAFNPIFFFDDFFALPGVTRTYILNHSRKLVLFKHHSTESVQQISALLDTQETNDITVSSYPQARRPLWRQSVWNDLSIFSRPNRRNTGFSVVKKTKPRLRTDEITALSSDEAIVVNLENKDYFILRV